MKNMDIMFRPPYEARSYLLLVTSGCSHNVCRFCSMYTHVPFEEAPPDLVEKQLMYAKRYHPDVTRLFLVNGDPFTLSADKLLRIADLIHAYLPEAKEIATYAQIRNIASKTDDELRALAQAGFTDLNIGLESGMDDVLSYMRKGYDSEEAVRQMTRLNEAGLPFTVNVIFGAAGAGRGVMHGEETAKVLNRVQPGLVFTNTIHASEGSDLYEDMKAGLFTEPDFAEYIREEERFLETLEMEDSVYFGMHPANILQLMGHLPDDKEKLLKRLRSERDAADASLLSERPLRFGNEGMICNWN